MNSKIEKVYSSIIDLMLLSIMACTVGIGLGVYILALDMSKNKYIIPIIIIVAVCYLIRKLSKNFPLFLVLHALTFVASVMVFGDDIRSKLLFIAMTIIIIVHSVVTRLHCLGEAIVREKMNLFFLPVIILLYLAGVRTQVTAVQNSMSAFLFGYVLLYILHMLMEKLRDVYWSNHDTADFPRRQIFGVNVFVMIVTVLLMFVAGGIFCSINGENIFSIIKNILLKLVTFIIAFLLRNANRGPDPQTMAESVTEMESSMKEFDKKIDLSDSDNSAFVDAIIIITVVAVIAFIIIMLVRTISRIQKNFVTMRTEGNDVIEFIGNKNLEANAVNSESDNERGANSNSMAFRREYKKLVKQKAKKKKDDGLLKMQPSYITKSYITPDEEDAKEITDIYEKARYSCDELDSNEVNRLHKKK